MRIHVFKATNDTHHRYAGASNIPTEGPGWVEAGPMLIRAFQLGVLDILQVGEGDAPGRYYLLLTSMDPVKWEHISHDDKRVHGFGAYTFQAAP